MSEPEVKPKTKPRGILANYEDSLHQLVLLKERPEYCAFFEERKKELYRVSDAIRIRSIAPEYDDYREIELGVCTVIIPFLDECWKRFGIIHPPLGFLRPPLEHLAAFLDPYGDDGGISDEDHHILARSLLHTFDSYQELADLCASLGRRPPDSSYARYKGRRRIPPNFDNHWVYALRCAGYTSGDIARGLGITEKNAEKTFLTHFAEVHGREYDPEEDFNRLPEPRGWRRYLRDLCGNCPLRFYLDENKEPYCKQPCKEINYYANKGSVKLRELRVKGANAARCDARQQKALPKKFRVEHCSKKNFWRKFFRITWSGNQPGNSTWGGGPSGPSPPLRRQALKEAIAEWINGIPMSERSPRWKVAKPVITRCPYCGARHETKFMNMPCQGCFLGRKGTHTGRSGPIVGGIIYGL